MTGVLFVHSSTGAPLGADTWIHALLMRSLDRQGFEVHAACAPGRPGARTPTFTALSDIPDLELRAIDFGSELFGQSAMGKVRAVLGSASALGSLVELARYMRRHGIRIVHTSDRPRDALACVLLARLTGAKCVIHVHVAYGEWMSRGLRWAMSHADALASVSAFVAQSLVRGGYEAAKVHTVLNAIDGSAWDPALDGSATRRELDIPADAPVLVCVARLFREKGQADLIRALALVERDRPDVKLLIVGQDYPAGTAFSSELRALAASLGVAENVVFTGHRRDIARLLAASDVYAMPSFEEPFGLAFAEAMAMRKPVVALDNGGTPEVVTHGKSGLLSSPGDIAGLAAHLRTLILDPALRARMGEYGRRRVDTEFTPARLARDVERVYATLVAPR